MRTRRTDNCTNFAKVSKKDGQIVMIKGDPIYADRIVKTVKWLKEYRVQRGKGKKGRKPKASEASAENETVDFGSRSLLDASPELLAPKASAPTLLPGYLDLWSQTAPEPFAVPEPGLFLHGPRSGPEDVQVIWRADVDEAALGSQKLSNLIAAVGAVRPSSLEAISLPFVATRRWLAKKKNALDGSADLEGMGDDERQPEPGGWLALRWRGDGSEIVDASGIRPGDTLVVPSSYGGIGPASRCFDPDATEEVSDLAERASLMGRGRPLLRVHPRVLAGLDLDLDREDPKAARGALAKRADDLSGWMRLWASSLGKGRKDCAIPWGDEEDDGWLVLTGERVKAHDLRNSLEVEGAGRASIEEGVESTTDDEDSPYVGSEVTLEEHSRHVEERAREYAERLGLSDKLVNDLALAAWLHDIGKVDRRFQRMLRGGSEIAYYRDEGRVLAKSGMLAGNRAERQRAQRLSGYPRGARHEVQSLAMAEIARDQVAEKAHDLELVMHLVASHHGHCRPFAPPIEDPKPTDITRVRHESKTFGTISFDATTSAHGLHGLDSPLADRFWLLVAKYGWLELCWLEAILRLADHRASEDEAGGQT